MNYHQLAQTVITELQAVLSKTDPQQIQRVIDLLAPAKRVFLAGVGREGLSTRAFAMRLMHLGKESHWVWDDTTPNMQAGDVFIVTSGSGEIGHLHYVAEKAKAAGATLLVISGARNRKTTQLADQLLWIPATVYRGTDDVVPSLQPMGNLFEQSLLITFDLIVMLLKERLNLTTEALSARHRNIE